MTDYDSLDAIGMAELVSRGKVPPDHFIREAARRAERLNPLLNAIVHRIEPQIGAQGPFQGVPLWLKDTGAAIRGLPITSGTRLHEGVVSPEDSTYGKRLKAAGFSFMGRTNTPELALSFTTEGHFHGACCNPWDPSRTPGGSSGGSAAIVAAGIAPLTQASDGAGSIRVPAAHTGTFGFKPSRLRNPSGPAIAEGMAGMATLHGVSRSVRDSAALLDVTHGPDIGDPWCCPPPQGRFLDATRHSPGRLRIGMQVEGPAGFPLDPEVIAGTMAAAHLLADLGHEVNLAMPAYDNAALREAWFTIAAVNVARGVRSFAAAKGISDPLTRLEPINAEWVRRADAISGETYLGAVQVLHFTSRAMGNFFQDFDIYLSPTTAEVAPKLGILAGDGQSPEDFFHRFWAHAPLTAVFNASGCPAMSVPLHWTTQGFPVGVHFGAGYGREEMLFSLAAQLETAAPWAHLYPNLELAA